MGHNDRQTDGKTAIKTTVQLVSPIGGLIISNLNAQFITIACNIILHVIYFTI